MKKNKKKVDQKSDAMKLHDLNLLNKDNLKFKNFVEKRNSSKVVIVRPK